LIIYFFSNAYHDEKAGYMRIFRLI